MKTVETLIIIKKSIYLPEMIKKNVIVMQLVCVIKRLLLVDITLLVVKYLTVVRKRIQKLSLVYTIFRN